MAENNCVVCFKNCHIYSVGECDHPVCFECSTRMRVLCCQNECPMCRHEMEMVVFTEKIRPFRRLKRGYALYDSKHHIAFENSYIKEMYDTLLYFVCMECQRAPVFESIDILNEHMKRDHDLYCCDLCADNLKIFPSERRYYTRQELNRHRRVGDVDDRSHRGHPLCEFCNVRYVDRDELYRHLRKDHLFCHFCDSEGIQQFYGMYDMLRDHYRKEHYLCEEGECAQEQLTSAYATEIDLKVHRALVHCKNSRKARTLELDFALPARHSNERRGRYARNGEEAVVNENAQSSQFQDFGPSMMASLEQDFPSLTNSAYTAPRPRFTQQHNKRLTFNEQNFPALGSEPGGVKLGMANDTDSRPSTSGSMSSANFSTPANHKPKKGYSKNTQQSNNAAGPSSSTWVSKAKEKKPAFVERKAQPLSEPELVKPPDLNPHNFPNLQKNEESVDNGAAASCKLSKKFKKVAPPPVIAENDNRRSKINYSQAMIKNSANDLKTDNKTSAARPTKSKEKKEQTPQNSANERKTHTFLLNANRKKVKMKPEGLISLNELSRSQNLLPRQTPTNSLPGSSRNGMLESVSETSNTITTKIDPNCDKKTKVEIIKSNDKNTKMQPTKKDKENEKSNGVKEAIDTKVMKTASNQASNRLKDSNKSATKIEVETDKKNSKATSRAPVNENDKKKATQLKTDKKQSCTSVKKPPPGFEKPSSIPPAPPPGFVPLQANCVNDPVLNENGISSCYNVLPDAPLVYQQPDEYGSKNTRLIEKIGGSLMKEDESALNDFKSTSLLYREGYISAMNYYLYCVANIKSERFLDIFVDLVALLPNIVKQQELWAVHRSAMPSAVESQLVDFCTVCFQILKLDDTVCHYSKHGFPNDAFL